MNFDEMFRPLQERLQLEPREQQRHLGWAVVAAMRGKENLVGEARTGTGKSFAYLVPAIEAAQRKFEPKRTVVSTETTALQDQLTLKDLPTLKQVYGDFTFRSLKGRSWYYCHNRALMMSRGNTAQAGLVSRLGKHLNGGLGDGEQRDLERRLGEELTPEQWSRLSGESDFCGDNRCKPDICFSSRARELAAAADIVVTNHAMLRTDADMRVEQDTSILDDFQHLIIDEAHTLEAQLIDGWSLKVSPWDITDAEASIVTAIQIGSQFKSTGGEPLDEETHRAFGHLGDALAKIQHFFKISQFDGSRGARWEQANFPLREVAIRSNAPAEIIDAMTAYEDEVPALITATLAALEKDRKYLKDALEAAEDQQATGRRKIHKGLRLTRTLAETLDFISKALPTRDGIVMSYGVPYGVSVSGMVRKNRKEDISIHVVPLDVSTRCNQTILHAPTNVLMSATMSNPINGTFDYAAASLGVTNYRTLMVDSPFTYATQQLVYITPGTHEPEPVHGAQFSVDELVDVITASGGRTLVLFTAKAELEHAHEQLKARGLPWTLHCQTPGVGKQKLVDAFKDEEHSVLLATKSFFTGVDFPGTTCSTVVLCKFPLPQFNTLCRQRMTWWRGRGFSTWYEREALLVFAQAAGRLIRSTSDRGVVAILDRRVGNPQERVSKTAGVGIRQLGSPVTNDLNDVRQFLGTAATRT